MRSQHSGDSVRKTSLSISTLDTCADRVARHRMERAVRNERTRITIEIALTIALAVVLGLFTPFKMPQGGGISLVMLPLFILSLRRGVGVGLAAGLLYGVLDSMIDPFVVHPLQYLLDYPIAFAGVALAGLFAPAWRRAVSSGSMLSGIWTILLPAVVCGTLARYLAHVASGAVFFAEYAPEGQNVWVYSAVYNLYVPVAAMVCFAAIALVMPALSRVGDNR